MLQFSTSSQKNIFQNLFLFNIFYFTLILTEKQLVRKGYLGFTLPLKLDVLEALVGLALGSFAIILITLVLSDHGWILRLILIGGLLGGSIFLNYFLFRFYYPPFSVTPSGDLLVLGETRWKNTFSYQFYTAISENYYLQTITANPGLEEYQELTRFVSFGTYLEESQTVPTHLTEGQFSNFDMEKSSAPLIIKDGGQEYWLYPSEGGTDLILSRYMDAILIFPENWITE